jgi:PAS domain S-box-containing protein
VAEALDPAWWPQHVHPEDRSRAFGVLTQLNVMDQVTHEFRFRRKDGSWVWIEDTSKVVKRTGEGAAREIVGSWNDITVRKRAELQVERLTRLYATLSLCNEAIVRSTSEVDLFPRICEAAVRAGGFSMAWIGMLDPLSGEVRPAAVYGEGSEFPHRAGISVDPDVPGGIGPTVTAVRTGQPSWFEDWADAPESAAWRDLVRPFGWQAAAALPLKRDGETVAALTIYSTEAQVFDEPRRRLLVEMAADISFALGSFKRDAEFRDAVVQLRQSETRYRAIFQQSGVPMLLLDAETAAIADANEAASRFYGWDHETLCRMYVDDINVLSREQVLPHLQKAAASTQTRFRFTHRLASGERREIESFTAPVVIDGRDRVVSIITDVTARKRAEAAVREKESLLVEAQRFARMGSWTLSQDGHRVWSGEMFSLFGLPAGSPVPTPESTLAMVHPDDRARLAATAADVWQARRLDDATYRIVRPDGTMRYVLTRAEYSDDPVHGPTLSGTTQDITDQHEAERQLRVKDLAIETSINGVVLGDLEGRLTYANAAALRMWGYTSAEEVQGRPLTEFWEDPGRAATALAKVQALGAFTGELRARQAAGGLFDALVSSSLVRDTEDRPVCIFAAIMDITARKQAEGDLRRSLAEKEALLREVHHRVKNNLQIVSSLLRLEVGRSSDPGLREAFTEMQTRILSMALLHETLYRADDFASVDLSVYLSRLVQHVFRAMAPSSGRVTLQLDLQPARVELDQAVPCGLIVSELVSNSLKHGFPGDRAGAVHVRVGILPDGRVALSVGDEGVGLPDDYHERASRSLGMQLVEDLTRQLKAEATVDTTGGTSYSLFFTPRAHRGGAPPERPPATA